MHALEEIRKAGLAEGQRHAAQEAAMAENQRACQAEVADKTARLAELQADVECALLTALGIPTSKSLGGIHNCHLKAGLDCEIPSSAVV